MSQQENPSRVALIAGSKQASLVGKLEDRKYRNAFLLLTRYLPRQRASVPAYESHFHNVSRPAGECVTPKGQDLRDLLRAVMQAAVDTNDRATIEATQFEIESFLTVLVDQVFAVIPGFDASAFANCTVDATREVAEFEAAAAEAGTTRNPSAIERAAREGIEATAAIEKFEAAATRQLHSA